MFWDITVMTCAFTSNQHTVLTFDIQRVYLTVYEPRQWPAVQDKDYDLLAVKKKTTPSLLFHSPSAGEYNYLESDECQDNGPHSLALSLVHFEHQHEGACH